MSTLDRGARIVLPSLNGAALSCRAATMGGVLAGCLRNRASSTACSWIRGRREHVFYGEQSLRTYEYKYDR
jgi:hypothetical protein